VSVFEKRVLDFWEQVALAILLAGTSSVLKRAGARLGDRGVCARLS
jgi:hypothetical protein